MWLHSIPGHKAYMNLFFVVHQLRGMPELWVNSKGFTDINMAVARCDEIAKTAFDTQKDKPYEILTSRRAKRDWGKDNNQYVYSASTRVGDLTHVMVVELPGGTTQFSDEAAFVAEVWGEESIVHAPTNVVDIRSRRPK